MKKNCILLLILLMCQVVLAQTAAPAKKDACALDMASVLTKSDGETMHTACAGDAKSFHIDLFDTAGKLVHSATVSASYLTVDLAEKINLDSKEKTKFPAGIYFWKVKYQALENGVLAEKKATGRSEIGYTN